MAESLQNIYSTTLSSGYTAGAGSISVAAAPAAGSGTYTMTLVIRDATTKAFKLLFRVTSVSGTTLTGAAEGTDASASSGDLVDGSMISIASLGQIQTDFFGYGTYANLPSTTGRTKGNRYKCSDSEYEFVFDGSAWVPLWGGTPVKVPPTISSMTRRHGSGTTAFDYEEDASGPVTIKQLMGSSYEVMGLHKAYSPGTTYSLILGFSHSLNVWSNQFMMGVMLRQASASQQILFGVGLTTSNNLTLIVLNDASYGGANPYNSYSPPWALATKKWIYFYYDGTNWNFYVSVKRPTAADKGVLVYSVAKNTYITPDRIGWAFASNAAGTAEMTVFDFEEGT